MTRNTTTKTSLSARIAAALGAGSLAAIAFVGLAPAAQAQGGCSNWGCNNDIHAQYFEGARGGGGPMLPSIE
ncbi:MAG: hypothetical protein ACTHZ5_00305 [Micrococcaceae bacterium]